MEDIDDLQQQVFAGRPPDQLHQGVAAIRTMGNSSPPARGLACVSVPGSIHDRGATDDVAHFRRSAAITIRAGDKRGVLPGRVWAANGWHFAAVPRGIVSHHRRGRAAAQRTKRKLRARRFSSAAGYREGTIAGSDPAERNGPRKGAPKDRAILNAQLPCQSHLHRSRRPGLSTSKARIRARRRAWIARPGIFFAIQAPAKSSATLPGSPGRSL